MLNKLKQDVIVGNFCVKSKGWQLINLYAGGHGEVRLAMQYLKAYFKLSGLIEEQSSNVFLELALCKTEHISMLIKLLKNLGYTKREVQTLVCSNDFYYAFSSLKNQGVRDIILDQIVYETSSILEYKKVVGFVKEPTILSTLNKIIIDKQKHLERLQQLLNNA